MSGFVNSLTGLPPISTDSSGGVILPKLPPEISEQISIGDKAVLKIVLQDNGNFQGILQTSDKMFTVPISKNFFAGRTDAEVEINVKIGESGKLIPLKEPVTEEKANTVSDSPLKNLLRTIEPTPLKISDFVRQNLQKMGLSIQTAHKISDGIKSVQTSLEAFGSENVTNNQQVLTPILQTLKQIAVHPENLPEYKEQLRQEVENKIEQKITGDVSGRSSDITTLETPLGKTVFESKIKWPVSEKIILNIVKTIPEAGEDFKVLDEVFKQIIPNKKSTLVFQNEAVRNHFKLLTDGEARWPKEVFNAVLSKLTVQGNNLFQNIVSFYRAAQQKNVEQWLGEEIAGTKTVDLLQDKNIAESIKNFLSASTKETPIWKIVEMPFFDGNWIAPLKVAVKKQNEKEKGTQVSEDRVRFIVETSFSKLGNFQFDGFADKTKRKLDLIIRTSESQSDDFCSNIINLFKKSLYAVNYTGNVKINRKEVFIAFREQTDSEGIYV